MPPDNATGRRPAGNDAGIAGSADLVRLGDSPLFRSLSPAELAEAAGAARRVEWQPGDVAFVQDATADFFFTLLEGCLQVVRATSDGRRVIVRHVMPGDVFGIAMALGRSTYPATASATMASAALAWPAAAWPRLAAAYPALLANSVQVMGARLAEAQDRLVELSTETVERRVAHALLRLAAPGTEGPVEIAFPVSREDIARLTGTTLHGVSRLLSEWERRGLVRSGRRRIAIANRSGLEALAAGRPPRSS